MSDNVDVESANIDKKFKRRGCTNVLFFCCYDKMSQTKFCICFNGLRDLAKSFIDGNFFQSSIMICILLNTISMAVEHHQQVNYF